mmetsp:Transcript_64/g.109  ORF Transcript_64/g.109 Transcript_64/m.109 type:complete len:212 (+) Transcript_64:434-1069(+)
MDLLSAHVSECRFLLFILHNMLAVAELDRLVLQDGSLPDAGPSSPERLFPPPLHRGVRLVPTREEHLRFLQDGILYGLHRGRRGEESVFLLGDFVVWLYDHKTAVGSQGKGRFYRRNHGTSIQIYFGKARAVATGLLHQLDLEIWDVDIQSYYIGRQRQGLVVHRTGLVAAFGFYTETPSIGWLHGDHVRICAGGQVRAAPLIGSRGCVRG